MARALVALLLFSSGCYGAKPTADLQAKMDAVACNEAGWPLAGYVAYFGTMGSGSNRNGHNTAWGISSKGWKAYVDEQVQPLLDGPNPPSRLVLHCVGPGWPRLRDGEPHVFSNGQVSRWFEYDWPLTVAQGREKESGTGRWPAMPNYLNEFTEVWRAVAEGQRSGGVPIETYAYTGMLQTPWLEKLRKTDPSAYRERLIQVAEFFQQAGFRGMYVDASAAVTLEADHLGLQVLHEIDQWPDFFVGVEAYPPASHDETTGPLRYFITDSALRVQHPWHPKVHSTQWQSKLDRRGLALWINSWGGGAYRLTPSTARMTAALDADIAVSWVRWNQLSPDFPPQKQSEH